VLWAISGQQKVSDLPQEQAFSRGFSIFIGLNLVWGVFNIKNMCPDKKDEDRCLPTVYQKLSHRLQSLYPIWPPR
jgi:hypothetical protein